MSQWLRGNVVGLVALFIALGGTAFAATVAKDSVTSKSIVNGAVKGKDVKDNNLKGTDIDESSLQGVPVADGSVTTAKLADNAVTGAKIGAGQVGAGDLGAITERAGAVIDDLDTTADDDQWTASTIGTASCNAGERAIGGGAALASGIGVGSDSAVRISRMSSDGTGWQVGITTDEGGSNDYIPYVYCLAG